jgi:hypothetical protein
MTSSDYKPTDEPTGDEVISGSRSGHFRVAIEIAVAALILVGIYYFFAPEERIELTPPLQNQEIDPTISVQTKKNDEEKANSQRSPSPSHNAEKSTVSSVEHDNKPVLEAETPTAAQSANPLEEDARSLIKKLQNGEKKMSENNILEQAEHYTNSGRLSDAYLLLFYAAREDNGPAAFALASLYDPNHFQPGNELLESPDSYQAHKWYLIAEKSQVKDARKRLEALRSTIEKQALSGDSTAQRLLLNWR